MPPSLPLTRGSLAPLGFAALALALTGCSKMAIDGEVTDVTGEPVVGAMVTAVGTLCQTNTDDEGKFALVCQPGLYDISISAPGYLSEDVDEYDAGERKRYSLGKRVLIKQPTEEGLLLFDGKGYSPMTGGLLERRMGGRGLDAYKHYCLAAGGTEVNRIDAGVRAFFDNKTEGWKPFRLDEEGCAYRMSPTSKTQWGVDYAEKPEYEERQVDTGKKIVLMDLTPGRYFIADWRKGFFTKVKDESGSSLGYSGYYLEVGG